MTGRTEPYERKIQLTGGTTYTVSLPKRWANDRSLDTGDTLQLYPRGDRLLLAPPSTERGERTVSLSAARHDPAGIGRLVAAAYVAGADVVRVDGSPDRAERAAVRDAVAGLVGIEIATETAEAVVARTMLDVADLPPTRTLERMADRTLTMHEEAVAAALAGDGDDGRRVRDQDDDVDRLFGLLSREFQRSLVEIPADGDGGLTPFDHYAVARQLERVADHATKIAEAAGAIAEPPAGPVAADLDRLATDARAAVERAFSEAIGECDPRALGATVADAEDLLEEAKRVDRELYERDLADGYVLATVLDSITRTVEYGVNVAEVGLRAALRDDPSGATAGSA
ncbi:AbrB/MazE/SpoVT family DNA-binding domain-containing protein [Halorubrum cibi]|uniref:Phosphate uptake regulator n=1 Tax=Halorubrum cibi TaxID=413815 RepID=A0A521CDM2_9EURY|nr:phosphate uptake regulator PhoU [Halorubrum cibi]SMO57529.1 Phosphate uptake regulator [Halorubrum cibi]